MSISKFKATCFAVVERVRRTRKAILITRFGMPIAEVVPTKATSRPGGWLGSLRDTGRIDGDIVSPAADPEEWEALGR